jgi:microsomal dipeptidase-like Zn-dependent dipeptidase
MATPVRPCVFCGGILIDTEHLSERAFYDLMDLGEARHYPVFASHVIPWHLGSFKDDKSKTELARRNEDLQRIFNLGGIVAPMLGTSVHRRSLISSAYRGNVHVATVGAH